MNMIHEVHIHEGGQVFEFNKTGGVVEKVLGLLQKIKTKTTPNSFFVPLVNISVYSVRRQYFVITSTPTFLVVQVVLFN